MIPNHEVMISFGGETKGNINYVTVTRNFSIHYTCKYVIVAVITYKLGLKQPKYAYKYKQNVSCKTFIKLFTTLNPSGPLIGL